jgi:hypothetical protein
MASDRQIAKKFMQTAIKDVRTAASLIVKQNGELMKREVIKQLKLKFKSSGDSRGFFKAVKIYDLSDSDRPAVYVRMGIRWMHVFEEGATISARRSPNLVIRLPDGAKLGLPRANYKNWKRIYAKYGKKFKIVKVLNGFVVLYPYQGKTYAVYKLQPQVKEPKLLSFFEIGDRIAATTDERIQKLLDGDL